MSNSKRFIKALGISVVLMIPAVLSAQFTAQSGTTSVTLDFATLESAASLQFASVANTADPASGFPAGFAVTGETPFEYDLNPFSPVGGSISHTGSVTFTIVGTETMVEVGNFEIGFDPARAVGGNSGFYVEDTVSALGILFDVGTPNPLTAGTGGVVLDAPLHVSPEFATYLSTNALAAADLTGAEVGAARVNASTAGITVDRGSTSVNLDFETLATAASLEFASVANTASPAEGFPAGFQITAASPFQYTLNPFAPAAGSINHTGSVTFTISGTETAVVVGNFEIGFDGARAAGGNSGFFVEDTISELGILFDVAAPETLTATPDEFFVAAPLRVSPEFATYLSTNELAASDLTGAEIGSAQISAMTALPALTPVVDNELLSISTRSFIGSDPFTDVSNASVIISGSEPMTIVFRGRSTSISDLVTADKLPNPTIDVVRIGEGVIATNSNWTEAENVSMLSGTSLDPASIGMGPTEALIILEDLAPGAYSLRVRSGTEGETGLVIVEAFAIR